LGIAASTASGLKENLGSMVKPLHAGLAARNGLLAARLAHRGLTAGLHAVDGPQGYLAAMDSQHPSLDLAAADLGIRWEILQTGVTVKLYPSCAATHPPLDVLIEIIRRNGITAEQVAAVDVELDSMALRLLIHPNPATGLEAKFSMPFCAAAAIVFGGLDISTFDADHIRNPAVQTLMSRVHLQADETFNQTTPLSHARVTVRLRDGQVFTQSTDGARGYPGRLTEEELAAKFADCAGRVFTPSKTAAIWDELRRFHDVADVRDLTALLSTSAGEAVLHD
jgi:2-methylcitrate dehydratase PrpD